MERFIYALRKYCPFIFKVVLWLVPWGHSYINILRSGILYTSYWEYLKFKLFKIRHYYPIPKGCIVNHPRRIFIGCNSTVFRTGCYIQAEGGIFVGNYCLVAPNVGLVSTNHDLYNLKISHPKPIKVGDYSWIGMGAVVTAGVELGTHTIVAAGAVVTKSFPEGHVVIGGIPAQIIKCLDPEKFQPYQDSSEYYGYFSKIEFEQNKSKYLDI